MDTRERLIAECDALLLAMLGSAELVDKWWHGANKGFDNQKPIDVDLDKVRDYLMMCAYGGW